MEKIWIVYKNPISVSELYSDKQSITCEVFVEDEISFFFTAIYASNLHEERKDIWISLKILASHLIWSQSPGWYVATLMKFFHRRVIKSSTNF